MAPTTVGHDTSARPRTEPANGPAPSDTGSDEGMSLTATPADRDTGAVGSAPDLVD